MKLKKWMKYHNVNISAMAEKLDVDRSSIHKYIDGTRTPCLSKALKIEKITKGKVTCAELLGDNPA